MPFKKGHIPWCKGRKLSLEHRLKMSAGIKRAKNTRPLLLARRKRARERRELKQRAKDAREAYSKRRKLERQARIEEMKRQRERQREIWGSYYSPETRAKISQALKGRTPWNKGVKAWNNGLTWPDEVKERISNGMIVFWMNRKKASQSADLSTDRLF